MSKDLYVKLISVEATDEDLRKLFSVSGKVTYIHMVRDAKSGEFAGCAYITMSSAAEAKDAIVTLDGALLINRTISVSAARPQKPKPRQRGKSRSANGPARGGKSRPG